MVSLILTLFQNLQIFIQFYENIDFCIDTLRFISDHTFIVYLNSTYNSDPNAIQRVYNS